MQQVTHSGELITTSEAARRLSVHRSTLARWITAGRIQSAVKVPGQTSTWLVPVTEVDRLLEEAA
jgi:excisionase family DNA binding protein